MMSSSPRQTKKTAMKLGVAAAGLGVAVLSILPALPPFNQAPRGLVALQIRQDLADGTQKALVRIGHGLSRNRRLYGWDAVGQAFLARVSSALPAAPLPGSRLPALTEDAVSSGTGNCLLFADAGESIQAAGVPSGIGAPATARLDLLTFHFYYLAADTSSAVADGPARSLWEWDSAAYVDYAGLAGISNVAERNDVIGALVQKGYEYAFDPAADAPEAAFYRLSAASPWLSSQQDHAILPGRAVKLTAANRAAGRRAVTFSVSPNTGAGFSTAYPVPSRAAADGEFPSGFEAWVSGPPEGRRVEARLVTVALGDFKGVLACEKTMSAEVRDGAGQTPAPASGGSSAPPR